MDSYSDEVLARRAATGELAAFEVLLARHRARVYSLCYRMAGNSEDAQDWAQDCFLRVFENLHRFDARRSFTPWLLTIASNYCINRVRARTRRKKLVPVALSEYEEPTSSAPSPLRCILLDEEKRRIEAAIVSLTPKLREALLLRIQEGLSFQELAAVLQVPLATASTRVRRALLEVRRQIEETQDDVE